MGYRLNRKLVLEVPGREPDGAGGFIDSWAPLGTHWAKMVARTGREAAGVAAPMSRVDYKIYVRAAPMSSQARPQPHQRFREGDRLYLILAVAEDDADSRYLVCTTHEEIVA